MRCFSWKSLLVPFLVFALAAAATAGSLDPISGEAFDSLLFSQEFELQERLEEIFPESQGYLITGPLDPLMVADAGTRQIYSSVRVICPDLKAYENAVRRIRLGGQLSVYGVSNAEPGQSFQPEGYSGKLMVLNWQGGRKTVQFNTIGQTWYLIWLRQVLDRGWRDLNQPARQKFAADLSRWLRRVDAGQYDAPPEATDYGLPENVGIFAPPPPYVIEGYQNYKDELTSHATIRTSFADGVDSLLLEGDLIDTLIARAPQEAFPNKEIAMMSKELGEFFESGGDMRSLQTLTAAGFDTLQAGEYFFVVDITGKIRFGHELSREEVSRIEEETGHKAPRANHAFLLPGEAVMTAGVFFVGDDDNQKLVKINARSGHYFYSNINASIREDIAERSDYYFLTLGHFLVWLDQLGIEYRDAWISKM